MKTKAADILKAKEKWNVLLCWVGIEAQTGQGVQLEDYKSWG
jgi:hypothetical protein